MTDTFSEIFQSYPRAAALPEEIYVLRINNALSLISPWTGDMNAGGNDLTALDEVALNNAAADASAAGRLRRNSTNLTWHDGTAARNILHSASTTAAFTTVNSITTANLPVIVVKSANETVNNSAVLQDDNHLVFAMAANTNYFFELNLLITGLSNTPDCKIGWTVPAACTMLWGTTGPASSGSNLNGWQIQSTGTTVVAISTESTTVAFGLSAVTSGHTFWGIVRNGANAGNLQLQWAQNTQTAEDVVFLKDSFLRITKLQ